MKPWKNIPALYIASGPARDVVLEHVTLRVHHFPAGGNADVQLAMAEEVFGWSRALPRTPEAIPASLALVIEQSTEPTLHAPIGAGVCLRRADVVDLVQMLREWLEEH